MWSLVGFRSVRAAGLSASSSIGTCLQESLSSFPHGLFQHGSLLHQSLLAENAIGESTSNKEVEMVCNEIITSLWYSWLEASD